MQSDHERPADFKTRQSERLPVDTDTTLRHDNWYSVQVMIRDVSQCGFMAECTEHVQIGSYVCLDIPGIGPVHAQVRWQVGSRMGGKFVDPISLHRCEWTAVKADPPQEAA